LGCIIQKKNAIIIFMCVEINAECREFTNGSIFQDIFGDTGGQVFCVFFVMGCGSRRGLLLVFGYF
jgi:NADH:ubiquinone oxidoreductase subunit K